MAQISIVKKSELEGAMRLDPEYYMPKYLGIVRALQALGAVPLSDVAKPVTRRFMPTDKPFHYIEIAEVDIRTGAINTLEIAGMEAPSRAKWIVREGDVIVSTVRPARNAVALIGSSEDGFVCSSGFTVLRPFKTSVEFLFAYLKTSIVASLLDRKTTATMYPAVSWEDVLSLPVVLPDSETQCFIGDKVKESRQKLKDSDSLYIKAEQLLLDGLDFKDVDLSHQLYYTVPYKNAREVGRLDAEHFQPKYERLVQHLAQTGKSGKLQDVLNEPAQKGITPPYDPDGDIVVVNSQHLGRYCLNIEATDRTSQDFWKQNARAQIKPMDVMIYATGAYIGRTNIWPTDYKATAGVDVLLVRPSKACNPYYLSVYLNSPLGILQTEKFASGSGQRHIYPDDVAHFMVYLPSLAFQQRIADLVIQSWEARQKARWLLEESRRMVEEMVERVT